MTAAAMETAQAMSSVLEQIQQMPILTALGVVGFVSYLIGYAGVQSGSLDGNGVLYALTNLVGASLVLVSLAEAFNLASALISVTWIVVSVAGIGRQLRAMAPAPKVPEAAAAIAAKEAVLISPG